jgi:MoaA/NifB/PqqE/SkfB family radical SAM enzyme
METNLNYNDISVFDLELIQDKINSRAKLDTGTFCNYGCSFCYYIDKLDQVTDLEKIKQRAKKIKDFGMQEIDLSGGESSLHKNWFEILDYCRELNFKSVSCLTNGFKFADKDFLKKSKEHGLSELLISLHGWDSASHAQIVKRKGSFEKIFKTIENAKELNLKIRLNCTVTGYNAPNLLKYAQLVNNIKPYQVNFLPLNYWQAAEQLPAESYETLSKAIKAAIDEIDQSIRINVRYIPFCFMVGYEKYIVDTYQLIFDPDDWNLIAYDTDSIDHCPNPTLKDYFERARVVRRKFYTKKAECYSCKYFSICDGVENSIASSQSVYPIEGDVIKDILHFRRMSLQKITKTKRNKT